MAEDITSCMCPVNKRVLEPVPFVRTNHSVKDVDPEMFIRSFGKYLKTHQKINYPKWCNYVKTGKGRQLAPQDEDWYYVKAASILRRLYLQPNTGVGSLRKQFSGKQRRGVAPNHTSLASGKILRYILQQFEKAGLVEQNSKRQGRKLTESGEVTIAAFARNLNRKMLRLDEIKENKEEKEEKAAEEAEGEEEKKE